MPSGGHDLIMLIQPLESGGAKTGVPTAKLPTTRVQATGLPATGLPATMTLSGRMEQIEFLFKKAGLLK